MHTIRISARDVTAVAALNESATADAIWEALPISARANRWGDEIYFEIPVRLPQADDARDVMEAGELGYWPPGRAFCIFWGRTPASRGDEIRAASPVRGSVPSGSQCHLVNGGCNLGFGDTGSGHLYCSYMHVG